MRVIKIKHCCEDCGEPLSGRSDKRFCDDYCRNHFHNQLNVLKYQQIKQTNKLLKINWRILQGFEMVEKVKVKRGLLLKMGFRFDHVTGIEIKKGELHLMRCYEYELKLIENDWVEVNRL